MNIKDEIELRFNTMDGIEFEKLLLDIFTNEFNCIHIEHLGKMSGSDKPAHSKVDIWVECKNDNKINNYFVLATTEKNAIKNNKVFEDIEKALDYIRNSGPYKNPKIIYATTEVVSPKDNNHYKKICNEFDIDFSFWGQGTIINRLIKQDPYLIEKYFNIPIFNGSVKPIASFVNQRKDSGEFSQTFMFREELVGDCIKSLKQNRFIILFGKQGCGKTRLALEISRYLNENGFLSLYARTSDSSIVNELSKFLNTRKNILLFIDDANKINYLKDIFNFAEEHEKIFLVLTTRDYAIEDIRNELKTRKFIEKSINPFTNNEIKEIIVSNFKEITNKKAIEYILDVSKGNLRFAIITARVLLGNDTQYQDLAQVTRAFYKGVENDLHLSENSKLENFIAALAFFDTLGLKDNRTLEILAETFDFNIDDLHRYVDIGYENELIDQINENVIKISDQIFATYLIYKKIYLDKTLKLKDLYNTFFVRREYERRFLDLIQSILNVYYENAEAILDDLRNILYDFTQNNTEQKIRFLSKFILLFPSDAIDFAYDTLMNQNVNEFLYKDFITILLELFEKDDYYKDISNKIINIYLKKKKLRENLIEGINSFCSIKRKSISRNYLSQIYLLKLVTNNYAQMDVLAINLVNLFVSFEKEESELSKDDKINIYRFLLLRTSNYRTFRQLLWKLIENIINNGKFESISKEYCKNTFNEKHTYDLRTIDLDYALEVVGKINSTNYEDKLLILKLLEPFKHMKKPKDTVNHLCTDPIIATYVNYFSKISLRRIYGSDLEHKIYSEISEIDNLTFLIENLIAINRLFGKEYEYKVNIFNRTYFRLIKDRASDKYDIYLIRFLRNCDSIYCNLFDVFSMSNNKKMLFSIVSKEDKLVHNPFIVTPLLMSIKSNDIDENIYNFAKVFFTSANFLNKSVKWGNEGIYYTCFNSFNKDFYYYICKAYASLGRENHIFLESLFYAEFGPENLLCMLKGDIALLAKIYFCQLKNNYFFDNNLKYGLYISRNNDLYFDECLRILIEYKSEYELISYLFKEKRFIPSFIKSIVEDSKFHIINYSYHHVVKRFDIELLTTFLKTFILKFRNDEEWLFGLSRFMSEFEIKERILFLEICLECQISIKMLSKIMIMEGPSGWTGSYATQLQEELKALEKFIKNAGNKINYDYIVFLKAKAKKLKESINYQESYEINQNKW